MRHSDDATATDATTPRPSPSGDAPAYAIATPLLRLIGIFQHDLAGVRFPGADAATLEAAAGAVTTAAAALAAAEAQLEAARAALAAAEEQLLHKGQRALAYARIYAEESPALGAALDEIVLGRARAREVAAPEGVAGPAPRRRGRPPRAAAGDASLFGDAPAAEAPALAAASDAA